MVTVLRSGGFRVVIFTNAHEPAHVHVFGDGEAKVNLVETVELVWAHAMSTAELRRAVRLVAEHRDELLTRWRVLHD